MAIARVTETSAASSQSFEDAIRQGLERATRTLRGVTSAWIKERQVKPGRPDRRVLGQPAGQLRPRAVTPLAWPAIPRLRHRPLRHLFPEHRLHLALAPPDRPGSPEELYAAPDRPCCFGVVDRGRGEALLRRHWVEIASAAWRGLPVIVALQSPAEAVRAAAWLRALRPDWSLRHSLELRDALEARGLLPRLAERAKAGQPTDGGRPRLVATAVRARA
jgi:Dodecin